MKSVYLYFTILLFLVSCNNDSISDNSSSNGNYHLEGTWYISGRTGIYLFEGDTVSYKYNENVMGYEEHIFTRTQGNENTYSISTKMRYIKQRYDESDEEFEKRVDNGGYSTSELTMLNFESPSWIVSDNNIYLPGKYITVPMGWEEKDKYLVSKIVKYTKNQFVIASLSRTIWDYAIDKVPTYNYYTTFTRVK